MILAFDTFMLSEKLRAVGIYQYAKNLFEQFGKLADENNWLTLKYFVSEKYSERFLQEARYAKLTPAPTKLLDWDRLWRMGLVNLAAAGVNADFVFSPAPKILPIGIPAIVTIHDIMPAKLPPELIGRKAAYELTVHAWVAAKLSAKIITDSEHSKKDIVETFSIDPGKISVVYLGYDKQTFNAQPVDRIAQERVRENLKITRPYIVHHGMVQSRKNILRLIRAYGMLAERFGDEFDLVLAGGMGRGSKEMIEEAAKLSKGRVIFTGTIPDETLGIVLKGALLAVVPSLYEGFCLPIVEAMASGIPTIGADNSCIPEVSGGVLRYFDAHSEEQMATAMEAVLSNEELQQQLRIAGLKRASEFSWERCARETLDVIRETGSERKIRARG